MARRGHERRLDAEWLYWQLIASGVGTVEVPGGGDRPKDRLPVASGDGGLPPGRVAEDIRSGRYLSLLERQRIAALREQGLSVRAIAARLGRAPSKVCRRLRRHLR